MKAHNNSVKILSCGHYLPKNKIENIQVSKNANVTEQWIIEKTGIRNRYYISKDETASSMALEAIKDLTNKFEFSIKDIQLIVVASFSQDYLFPPLSAKLHAELKLKNDCQIIDINTNCTGIITAIAIAVERMKICSMKYSLIVGLELLSNFTNKNDADTSIFFSDGASAILLGDAESDGYLGSTFLTDSSTFESVRLRGGGSQYPANMRFPDPKTLYIEQNGLATWKQAITNLPITINKQLTKLNLTIDDIDFVIFHQANKNLITYIMGKLKIPISKTYINVDEIGNTGAASIGIALSEAIQKKLIKKGDLLLLAGVGAGFNFGATVFKF